MPGILNNRYRLEKKLGEGSMGVVYLATDEASGGARVAIKEISIGLGDDKIFQRLALEYDLLRKLDHPGIARALDVFLDRKKNSAYLVTEFVDGVSFVEALKGAKVSEILSCALEVAKALEYLNSKNIFHGDIKPGNILVSGGVPRLIDFGLAVAMGDVEGVTGTVAYMAPEILGGAAPNPRSDIYSLGALLYETISGRPPHEAPTTAALLKKIVSEAATPLRKRTPSVSNEAAAIVDKLLSRDPVNRYQTASGLVRDISTYLKRPLTDEHRFPVSFTISGRDSEIAELKSWLGESREKGFGSIRISGEKGVGKTRLLDEICDSARAAGIKVVAVSFGGDEDQYGAIERAIARATGFSSSSKYNRGEAKYAAWKALAESLEKSSSENTILLAFDNIESLKPYPAETMAYLVGEFSAKPGAIFIVAEEGDSAAGIARTMRLKPLNDNAVASIASEAWGERPSSSDVRALVKLTGGNPMLLIETLRSAPRGKVLSDEAPSSIEALYKNKVSGLDASESAVLRVVAILGKPVDPDEAATLTGLKNGDLFGPMKSLEAAGLINRVPSGFVTSNPAISTIVVATIPSKERRLLRIACAKILEGNMSAPAEVIARHFIEGGDGDKGADWALKAAGRLMAIGAPAEAAGICGAALNVVSEGDRRKNAILEDLGRAATLAGMFDEALQAWRELIERADESPLKRAGYRIEAARCLRRKGDYDLAEKEISLAEKELVLASDGDPHGVAFDALELRAMLALARGNFALAGDYAKKGVAFASGNSEKVAFLTLGGVANTYLGEYDKAVASLEEALSLSRSGDEPRRLMALSSLGVALQHRGDLQGALERYAQASEAAERLGDLKAGISNAMNKATVLHQLGDYAKAVDEYRVALKMARQTGADAERARIENNLANLYLYLGDADEALRLTESSLELSAKLGLKQVEAYNRLLLGDVYRESGETISARREYTRAIRILESMNALREQAQCALRLSSLYLDMGERTRARDSAESVIELSLKLKYRPFEAQARLILSRLWLKEGDASKALLEARSALEAGDAKSDVAWEIMAAEGAALMALGETDEAARVMTAAREMAVKLRDAAPSQHRERFLSGAAWRELDAALVSLNASSNKPGEMDARWEKLLEINRRLNLEHDLTRLLELIMDSVLTLVRAERGFLILDKDGKLDVPVARNIDRESITKAKDKISRSIAEEVLRSGAPLMTVDAQEDGRLDRFASVRGLKLRSILSIPLRVKEKIVGALYVDNRFQKGAFGDDDRKVMEAFAEQAAIAIENARLIEENESRRKKLEASNRKIQLLVEELERKVKVQNSEIVTLQRDLERVSDNPFKYDYANIIGGSKAMRKVFALMDRITDSNVPVLIEGESGAGKELVARALHFNGPRKAARFLSENCSAIPETLLESELFGHEKGAFTGASDRKIGVFEAADGGTIFLDEIGDMSLNMQAKLLRALQEGEIRRVGGEQSFHVDVRVISATHRRLETLIKEGRFREDLYWRLNVIKIAIPPLRERIEDIPQLVEYFIRAVGKEYSRKLSVSPEALRALMAYDWPGNVRELENEIKKSALTCEGDTIEPGDLSARVTGGVPSRNRKRGLSDEEEEIAAGESLGGAVEEFERRFILKTLEECSGNRVKAAKKLGIARRTLYDKLSKYGVEGDE